MGSPLTLSAGALVAALMIAAMTINAEAPLRGAAAPPEVEEAPAWRTDLAAAMAEARRTNRPLLAVFR